MTKVTIRYAGLDTYEWRANGTNIWQSIMLHQIHPQRWHSLIQNYCKCGGFLSFNYYSFNPTTLILIISNIKGEVE